MRHYLFYNGSFLKDDSPLVTANNRGFRYGDGLFETMRIVDGKLPLVGYHLDRLFKGLDLLQFELPSYFKEDYLLAQIEELSRRNRHGHARVRLVVFRGNGGLYDPENHFPNCIIQSWPLPDGNFGYNEKGLITGLCPDVKKSCDILANLKSNNYLPYILAALYARKNHWDDALVLNTGGNICDSTIANVFMVKKDIIFTPSLQEGCVAGVMRRFLLERLPVWGFRVTEWPLRPEDIEAADELFLTNALGIRWVAHYGAKQYGNTFSAAINHHLQKKNGWFAKP
jgi:branched-chain amino acid aminotransferase